MYKTMFKIFCTSHSLPNGDSTGGRKSLTHRTETVQCERVEKKLNYSKFLPGLTYIFTLFLLNPFALRAKESDL